MLPGETVNFGIAFVAGIASFISPCVLPLFPSYLSFITGLSFEEISARSNPRKVRRLTIVHSLLFILGFSLVFILLGASASSLGQLLSEHQAFVRKAGGFLVMFFGMYLTEVLNVDGEKRLLGIAVVSIGFSILNVFGQHVNELLITMGSAMAVLYGLSAFGLFDIGALLRERKIHLKERPAGYLGSVLVGIAFAAGWTPCIGPILGSILTLAANEKNVLTGVLLLFVYSLGLGIPFFLSSVAFNSFLSYFARAKRYIRAVTVLSGIFLIFVGALIYMNYMAILSAWLNSALPFVGL